MFVTILFCCLPFFLPHDLFVCLCAGLLLLPIVLHWFISFHRWYSLIIIPGAVWCIVWYGIVCWNDLTDVLLQHWWLMCEWLTVYCCLPAAATLNLFRWRLLRWCILSSFLLMHCTMRCALVLLRDALWWLLSTVVRNDTLGMWLLLLLLLHISFVVSPRLNRHITPPHFLLSLLLSLFHPHSPRPQNTISVMSTHCCEWE